MLAEGASRSGGIVPLRRGPIAGSQEAFASEVSYRVDRRLKAGVTTKGLIRQRPKLAFPLRQRHHVNRVPRAAFQERPVRSFARTQFAPDAGVRVHHNPPERRMLLVR